MQASRLATRSAVEGHERAGKPWRVRGRRAQCREKCVERGFTPSWGCLEGLPTHQLAQLICARLPSPKGRAPPQRLSLLPAGQEGGVHLEFSSFLLSSKQVQDAFSVMILCICIEHYSL